MSYDTVASRRAWYIDWYGTVRAWAVASVVDNPHLRKRLPRLTALAVAQGKIKCLRRIEVVNIWDLKQGDLFKIEGSDVILEFYKMDGAYCVAYTRTGQHTLIGLCKVELL